jgi:hypothetical protein
MQKRLYDLMRVFLVFLVASQVSLAQQVFSKSANVFSVGEIQRLPGWESCGGCAGRGGAGPGSGHGMAQFVGSPSLSGASAQFSISSGTPFANALWWKQLGRNDGITNFVYDLFFFINNPGASQALEFDVNYADGAHRWIFGTQCNIAAGQWDVYANAAGAWRPAGVGCAPPSPNTWHHLVWEFSRSGNQAVFVAFTYDGVRHLVNRAFPARASGVHELNVAFQMDMTRSHTPYSVWLDNVTLRVQ